MTEHEWMVHKDVAAMLESLSTLGDPVTYLMERPLSNRKLRLFACACCRQVWDRLTDPRSRKAVEVAERYADGGTTRGEREQARGQSREVACSEPGCFACAATETFAEIVPSISEEWFLKISNPVAQAVLLRDIAGNPFRPVRLMLEQRCAAGCTVRRHPPLRGVGPTNCGACGQPWVCPWLTPAVLGIARCAYDGRDFAALPVLADALEEAGCGEEAVLYHLRSSCPCCREADFSTGDSGVPIATPALRRHLQRQCACGGSRLAVHARGCWALDLVLGLK